jgi:NAD(P)-dependent dehydrogenase (short-subunit alcohol dehydrogenase family)/acyl carrier protein/SAM-dependent methyltransferase
LAKQLEQGGQLSAEQVKLLPDLFKLLVQQHQTQLGLAKIRDCLYEVQWKTKANFRTRVIASYLLKPTAIQARIHPHVISVLASHELSDYEQLLEDLERISVDYIIQALQTMGWTLQPSESFITQELIEKLDIIEPYHQLFDRLLQILEDRGILQRINYSIESQPSGYAWQVLEIPTPVNLSSQLQTSQAKTSPELKLLNHCGYQLTAVLQGTIDPIQVLFPQGNLNLTYDLYHHSPGAKAMNRFVQQVLTCALEQLPLFSGIRILEIGGGTGGTTAHLLHQLASGSVSETLGPGAIEYTFTDVGDLFLTQAKAQFKAYDFVQYEILNIEKDPQIQGFKSHHYHLVVAANVLHATPDLRQTLHHIQQLLMPGGLLILLEGTTRQAWVDLSFGLLPGWWHFRDRELRQNYPLLTAEQWQSLLLETGFTSPTSIPSLEAVSGVLAQQALILAQMPQSLAPDLLSAPGHWLIFADRQGIGTQLATTLRLQGHTCSLVLPGDRDQQLDPQLDQQLDQQLDPQLDPLENNTIHLDPHNPVHYQQLLVSLNHAYDPEIPDSPEISSEIPLTILHLWSLDLPPTDVLNLGNLETSPVQSCGSVVNLVQALAQNPVIPRPRLWLITQGSQPVQSGALPGLAQSPLWGMGRVVALEHPQSWGGMIDLDPEATISTATEQLLAEITPSTAPNSNAPNSNAPDFEHEDHIAFRDGRRYVSRLVPQQQSATKFPQSKPTGPTEPELTPIATPIAIDPEVTYLITGGLGFLGLKVAQWLGQQGAKHLAITGRRELPPREQWISLTSASLAPKTNIPLEASIRPTIQALQALEAEGATVHVFNADVADAVAMAGVIHQVNSPEHPLRGIIHAAGVAEYKELGHMTLTSLDLMLRPKTLGAWNLHHLTREMTLDFLVYFSSAGAVWGAKGQGHYDAANHFLDALAHHRRSLGLPALSIDWANVGVGGMVPEIYHEWLTQIGLEAVSPDHGFAAMGRLLNTDTVQTVIAKVDWQIFKPIYESYGSRSLFKDIELKPPSLSVAQPNLAQPNLAQSDLAQRDQSSEILQHLQEATDADRSQRLLHYLQTEIAQVLRFPPSQFPDPDRGLFELGLDSLMALELKQRLEASLQVSLPSTLAFEHPTINSLSQFIELEILGWSNDTIPSSNNMTGDNATGDNATGDNPLDDLPPNLPPDSTSLDQQTQATLAEIESLSEDEVEAAIAEKLLTLETLINQD